MEKLGGRKFIFATLVTILAFILVVLERVTSLQWLQFVIVVGATYVIGNVSSKIANKV